MNTVLSKNGEAFLFEVTSEATASKSYTLKELEERKTDLVERISKINAVLEVRQASLVEIESLIELAKAHV